MGHWQSKSRALGLALYILLLTAVLLSYTVVKLNQGTKPDVALTLAPLAISNLPTSYFPQREA